MTSHKCYKSALSFKKITIEKISINPFLYKMTIYKITKLLSFFEVSISNTECKKNRKPNDRKYCAGTDIIAPTQSEQSRAIRPRPYNP